MLKSFGDAVSARAKYCSASANAPALPNAMPSENPTPGPIAESGTCSRYATASAAFFFSSAIRTSCRFAFTCAGAAATALRYCSRAPASSPDADK